jgi:hypothetical protein
MKLPSVRLKVREKKPSVSETNKSQKSKKCNKIKRHIANYEMNTQSQNTKTKRQHRYTQQK